MSKCPWARYRTPNRSTTDYSDKEKCIFKKYYIIVFLSLYRYLIDIVNIKNSKLEFLLHNYTVTLWVSMTRKHPLMALHKINRIYKVICVWICRALCISHCFSCGLLYVRLPLSVSVMSQAGRGWPTFCSSVRLFSPAAPHTCGPSALITSYLS